MCATHGVTWHSRLINRAVYSFLPWFIILSPSPTPTSLTGAQSIPISYDFGKRDRPDQLLLTITGKIESYDFSSGKIMLTMMVNTLVINLV